MRYAAKQVIKLARRRKDYDEMIKKPGDPKSGWTGYHRPGSLKK